MKLLDFIIRAIQQINLFKSFNSLIHCRNRMIVLFCLKILCSVLLFHCIICLVYLHLQLAFLILTLKVHLLVLAFVERKTIVRSAFFRFQRRLAETLYRALSKFRVKIWNIRITLYQRNERGLYLLLKNHIPVYSLKPGMLFNLLRSSLCS